MRKTDKKIDNQLRLTLTDVCEAALKDIEGFQWLTHVVNYSNFPKSLRVVCVFDTRQDLLQFSTGSNKNTFLSLIEAAFLDLNIKVKDVSMHVAYDTEETCDVEHDGNWAARLARTV